MKITKETFICKLTNKLAYRPVLGEDGKIYSEKEYMELLTNDPHKHKKYIHSRFINKLYQTFLQQNEDVMNEYEELHFMDILDDCIKNDNFTDAVKLLKKCKNKKNCGIYLLSAKVYKNEELAILLLKNASNLNIGVFNNIIPHYVCWYGTSEMLQILIDNRVNVDIIDNKMCTPAMYLLHNVNKDITMMQMLIQQNINLEHEDVTRARLIHYACDTNRCDVVKLLMEQNVDLMCKDKYGLYPLHYASMMETPDILKLFVEKQIDLNLKDDYLQTPLHHACSLGNIEVVKYLLQQNVATNIYNKDNKLAFDYIHNQELKRYIEKLKN